MSADKFSLDKAYEFTVTYNLGKHRDWDMWMGGITYGMLAVVLLLLAVVTAPLMGMLPAEFNTVMSENRGLALLVGIPFLLVAFGISYPVLKRIDQRFKRIKNDQYTNEATQVREAFNAQGLNAYNYQPPGRMIGSRAQDKNGNWFWVMAVEWDTKTGVYTYQVSPVEER